MVKKSHNLENQLHNPSSLSLGCELQIESMVFRAGELDVASPPKANLMIIKSMDYKRKKNNLRLFDDNCNKSGIARIWAIDCHITESEAP
jgi:hypothetical protein